jgi:hypothetical protein
MVNVEFTNTFDQEVTDPETGVTTTEVATTSFNKEFQFKIDETLAVMKNTVKQYLDELNFTPPVIDDLEPDAEVAPVPPTAAELARTGWDLDVAKLKKAQELLDCGVTFSAPQLTALATLRGKVATNFKAEYLG